jgi:cytoskeletal protein CcmA (bactofilin family)
MWKWKEEEKPTAPGKGRPQPGIAPTASPVTAPKAPLEVRAVEAPKQSLDTLRLDVAHIGKSVIIKGELSGSEDLYLDGEVEGSIELRGHNLTIGPNGRVRANVQAKDVVVHGKVNGNVHGAERVELKKSAILVGDISTQRVAIEDGAYFKGGIDILKEAPRQESKPEPKREPAQALVGMPGAASQSAVAVAPASLLDTKK